MFSSLTTGPGMGDFWSWLAASDSAYSSIVAIGFTVNSWTASLETIRTRHSERVQKKIQETISTLRDKKWLNSLNGLNASEQSDLNAKFKKVMDYLHVADGLGHTLKNLERWFHWAMVACSMAAVGFFVFKYHSLLSVLLLFPYPIFCIVCRGVCWNCKRNINKYVRPILAYQEQASARKAAKEAFDGMVNELAEWSSQLEKRTQTTITVEP